MKIKLILLLLSSWTLAALAQPAVTNLTRVTVTNVVAGTNIDEILRRKLREAYTNPTSPEILIVTNPPAAAGRTLTAAVTNAPAGTNLVNRLAPVPSATTNAAAVPAVAGAINPALPAPGAIGPARTNAVTLPVLPAADESIAFNYSNMPLDQALEEYSRLVGRTLLRQAQIAGVPNAITLKTQSNLTKSEAVEAFKAILAMNGVTVIDVGEKFAKVVPSSTGFQEAQKFSSLDSAQMSELGQYLTKVVQLKNIKPSGIVQALQVFGNPRNPQNIMALDDNQLLVLRDFEPNIKRMMELIEKIDIVPEPDYKLEVIPIKYGKVEEIYSVMSSVIGGGGGGGGAIGGTIPGRTTGRTGGRTGTQQRQPYQQGIPGQPMQPQAAQPTVGGAQSDFQRRLSQIVNRAAGGEAQLLGDAKITPDVRANALIVYANKQDMSTITNIVAKVDVPLPQVLIEAIIMEVSLDNSKTIGVSMLQRPRTTGNWQIGGGVNNGQQFLSTLTNAIGSSLPSGFSYFGQLNNDFDVALKAIATDGSVNVLSKPRIQTTHAVPANFSVGDSVPYITGSTFSGGFGNSSYYQEKEVLTTLDVTPFITPDGLVVMDIVQTIDQLGTPVTIDGNPVPTIKKRSASATISVKDGETIMLGGYITTSKTQTKSGVPFLKDIPGLGVLFRSKTDTKGRTELIVLMRPTVLPTPQDAARIAKSETDRLPGVRQAEKTFQSDEEERHKKIDAQMKRK